MEHGDYKLSLADGLRVLGINHHQLWLRYLAIGGDGGPEQIRAHVTEHHCPHPHEHTVIVQALNEAFLERGHDHPVSYEHH